jgi:DNA-directed RNA polymerase subunit N (RpoN/RPB10)
MIIPIRCFTCGKVIYRFDIIAQVIGNKWDKFLELLEKDLSIGYI